MGLLKPAANNTAFLKAGMMGFEGSGKTHTAMLIAIGLTKMADKKKIAMFDTEKGSDFWVERLKAQGIQLDVVKSRSFKDLLDTMREAEASGEYGALIVDSISHVWAQIQQDYKSRKGKSRITMDGWGELKTIWRELTDLYLNSKLHVLLLGRAGYEYEHTENEDGKTEIQKVGTKMKVEGEMGYEPDLLIEMHRRRRSEVENNPDLEGFINVAVILKDRTDTMNGRHLRQPKFADFTSVIKHLNIGGEHAGTDTTRNSEGLFNSPAGNAWELMKQLEMALEELDALLIKLDASGTSADAKKKRVQVLEDAFGTSSKVALEKLGGNRILKGIQYLKEKHGLATRGFPTTLPAECTPALGPEALKDALQAQIDTQNAEAAAAGSPF
jgi:hypothetical protein